VLGVFDQPPLAWDDAHRAAFRIGRGALGVDRDLGAASQQIGEGGGAPFGVVEAAVLRGRVRIGAVEGELATQELADLLEVPLDAGHLLGEQRM
jgi:hypothetical protein